MLITSCLSAEFLEAMFLKVIIVFDMEVEAPWAKGMLKLAVFSLSRAAEVDRIQASDNEARSKQSHAKVPHKPKFKEPMMSMWRDEKQLALPHKFLLAAASGRELCSKAYPKSPPQAPIPSLNLLSSHHTYATST